MMIGCPLRRYLNFRNSKEPGLMTKAGHLTFSYCSRHKEIGDYRPAISISYEAHKVPPTIPMRVVGSHSLL